MNSGTAGAGGAGGSGVVIFKYTTDTTAPTVTLAASAATSVSSTVFFTITGDEQIRCTDLDSADDFTTTNLTIVSFTQTTSTVCTITATSSATAGGGAVTSTLASKTGGGFSIRDLAGNPQTTLTGSPQQTVVTVPSTDTTAPTIGSIAFTSSAGSDNTYMTSDVVSLTVIFSEPVTVVGTPVLPLAGLTSKNATYASGSGTSSLVFSYTVASGDTDSDGLAITANTLAQSGGSTIRDASNNNATLTHAAITAQSAHTVDTTGPTAPTIDATADDTYGEGEVVEISATFNEPMAVTGTPTLEVQVTVSGTTTYRNAQYSYASGNSVYFNYTVVCGDTSSDLTNRANPISLSGGTITDVGGNTATITASSGALASNAAVVIDTTGCAADSTAPTVSSLSFSSSSGSDNTYKIGDTISVTVDFSETVNVTGIPVVPLAGLSSKNASYASGSGTTSLVFSYTVDSGDADTDGLAITANTLAQSGGSTIKDAAGNNATLTHAAVSTQSSHKVDGVVPTMTPTTPADNATGVSISSNVVMEFSETVTAVAGKYIRICTATSSCTGSSATGNVAQVFQATAGTVSVSGSTVTVNPADLSTSTTYYISVDSGAFVDGASNGYAGLSAGTSWDFTSVSAPTVSSVSFTSSAGADNTYMAGDTVSVTVAFSATVSVTGTPRIPLAGLSSKYATYASGTGTSSLVFSYTVLAGDNDTDGLAITANTLELNSGTINDGSGNAANLAHSAVSTASAHKVDTTAPTATWTPPSSPSSSRTLSYTLTFSESVTGISAGDFSQASGTATCSSFTPSGSAGTTITVTAVCSTDGTVVVRLASGAVTDDPGNSGPSSNADASSITIDTSVADTTAPSVSSFTSSQSTPTNSASFTYSITFSESVTGVASGDFSNTGTATGCSFAVSAGSGAGPYTITVSSCGSGTVTPQFASSGATDTAGNDGPTSAATATTTITRDTTAPTMTPTTPADDSTGVAISTNLVLTFNENITPVTGKDIKICSGTPCTGARVTQTFDSAAATVTVSGSTVTINPADLSNSTTYYVSIDSGAFTDTAGNDYGGLTAGSTWNFTTVAAGGTTTTTVAPATTTTIASTTTTTVAVATSPTTTTTVVSRRITICHATSSRTNPYVAVTVDINGLNGHGDHTGDIIPAPTAGCSRAAVTAATSTTSTTIASTTTAGRGRPGATTTTAAPTTTLPERQRITICHATKSSTNPYVEITVDLNGLNGHGDHGDDIIPAPAGGCDARAVKEAAKEAETVAKKIEAKEKITICHATSSETNPFVEITIDTDGLAGHADHKDDIIPAPAGGCSGQGLKKATEIKEQKNNGRITIFHATSSATHPFVEITVDMDGLNGHGDHQNDIIPAPSGGCPKQITSEVKEKMVRSNDRIKICHATGSATNPYVEITIDTDGLAGHGDHKDDIIPAPAEGCDRTAVAKEVDNRKKPSGKITICHATRSTTNPFVEITVDLDGLNGHGDHLDDIIPAPLGGCGQEQIDDRLKELGIKNPDTIDICHATKDPNRPYIKETVAFDSLDGHGQHNGDIIPAPAAGCSCGAIDEALRGKSAPAGSLLATQSQVNAERNGDAATDLYELVEPQGKKSGSRSASVSLTPDDSAPSMQLLSATVEGGGATVKITSSGVDYNKPSVWQAEGFGAYCWKLEPFGDNDYRYLLPDPSAPPDGRFAGLPYSAVIVKAGSIRESDPEYQVNTTFMNPAGGTEVFADVNRNGVSDPGGQGGGLLGDKSISHIILCVGESEFSDVAVTTTTTTIAPTETVPDQSTTTTTLPAREIVNACPKVSDEEPTSSTTTTTTTIRPTTTSTTVRSSTTTTTSSTSTTSTTVRPTTTTTTVRPTTTTVGSLATSTTARPTTTSTTVRSTTTTVGSLATSTTARATTTSTTVRPTSTTTSTTVRLTTTTVAATTSTLAPGSTTTTLPSGETTTTSTIAPDDDSPQPLTFEIVAPRGAPLPKDATITLVVSTGSDVETMVLTMDLVEFTPDFRYSSAQTTEAAPRADSLESLPETGGPRWTTEQRLGWLLGVFGMFLASVSMSARRRRRRRGA